MIKNLVAETTTSTGTGDATLSPSLRSFSSAHGTGSENTFYYGEFSEDGSEFEIGISYMRDSDTLARNGDQIVLESSNSNSPVNFSAGTKQVVNDLPASIQARQFLHIQHKVAASTDGGSSTSGSWQKRTLNTVVKNEITGASLSSSVISLPAGTYKCNALGIFAQTNRGQVRLQDTTNTATLILGMAWYATNAGASTYANSPAYLEGKFTLAAAANVEFQYRVESSLASFGLGYGATWGENVFANIVFEKTT